jgi:hypothetical protein
MKYKSPVYEFFCYQLCAKIIFLKMNKILLIFGILKMTLVICDYYDAQLNKKVDSTLDPIWLIQSTKYLDKIFCLNGCNINTECYTATFTTVSIINDNCFLYRKKIPSTEMVSSQNSNIYTKKCNLSNPVRTLNDTTCINKRMLFLIVIGFNNP